MALRPIVTATSPGSSSSSSANPMYHFNQQQQQQQILPTPILSSFTQQQQHLHHHHRRRGGLPSRDTVLYCSLMLNVILFLALLLWTGLTLYSDHSSSSHGQERTWNGGHPASSTRQGSCWCGKEDGYCLCTPNLAIDLIITSSSSSSSSFSSILETNQNKNNDHGKVQPIHHHHHDTYSFWLVRRKDTNQFATMGGFVDVNETVEHAIQRELKEEMNIDLTKNNNKNNKVSTPRLVGIYSDPRRDNRRRTVSLVYAVHFDTTEDDHHNNNNQVIFSPKAGDDAKEIVSISIHDVEQHSFFADHRTILLDYRTQWIYGEPFQQNTQGDFASDIVRSTCPHDS
jgi:8-oxo-dGTP diphosphatase